MKSVICNLLAVATLALMLGALAPPAAQADDYWTNHWNWYDNTYRPYYYRNYAYGPGYSSYYGPSNYGYYGAPGYYNNYGYNNYGYGYSPYRSYYGAPGVGYGRLYGGGSAVNVGPLSFGWR